MVAPASDHQSHASECMIMILKMLLIKAKLTESLDKKHCTKYTVLLLSSLAKACFQISDCHHIFFQASFQ